MLLFLTFEQMSSSGSIFAMISSLKANRDAIKAGKKDARDRNKLQQAKQNKWVDPVQLAPDERQKMNLEIQAQLRKEKRRELIFTLTVTILLLAGVTYVSIKWVF